MPKLDPNVFMLELSFACFIVGWSRRGRNPAFELEQLRERYGGIPGAAGPLRAVSFALSVALASAARQEL